tara:strand:- start:8895 stop:9602 length:708 start_codon:yes stop_codon:yes gene_type:complete
MSFTPTQKKKLLLFAALALLLAIPMGINVTREVSDPSASLNLPPMPEDEADRFIQMASQNYFFHEYPKAIENYRRAIEIYEIRGATRLAAKTHQSIGDVYKITNHYDKAEREYLSTADYQSKIGNLAGKAKAYKKIGVMHSELGHSELALKWYRKSLEIIENSPPSMILGQIQEILGRYYWKKKKGPKALEHLTKAKTAFLAIGFQMGVEHMTSLMHLIQEGYSSSKPKLSEKKI